MSHRFGKRLGVAALATFAAGIMAVESADARPARARGGRPAASAFQLFAGTTLAFEINRVYCGIRAIGETCVDVSGSPVLGGGSWPRGSGNAYIFNSGLQVAGIINPGAGFAWAGDTVGTWFMDPRGDQQSGEGVTDIFSSLDAGDAANWPSAAAIQDTAIYNPVLIGRQTISQQDIWWRYWDGNPNQTAGRGHPAGILVEQRGLGWNFPSGNEDIVYFVTRFINITASGASCRQAYDTLSVYGYTTPQIDEIAAVGTRFQQLNEAKFGVDIPDCGYAIENAFASVFMDADVGTVVGDNFATASLVHSLAYTYVGDFEEPTWQYPSTINSPPFGANPGFIGIKYLRTPINPATGFEFGITMFSNTSNGGGFPDAVGVQQLYRYLSGTVSPAFGDNNCTVSSPQTRRLCSLLQIWQDIRMFASSGPFTLEPGNAQVFVTAYVFAAPVASAIAPFVGGNPGLLPGIPPGPQRLLRPVGDPTRDTVRVIDRATGWQNFADNPTVGQVGTVEQSEVSVVPRSLLGKSLVAQAVFDNGFLLPFAPEAPDFFVVPGDNRVTVVWQKSATEDPTGGDPYFNVAAAPFVNSVANPLYDPNYRRFDVEGYRVWRGRTPSQMVLIAQFDYETTSFTDYTGVLYNAPSYGSQCAPELGLQTSCPVTFDVMPAVDTLTSPSFDVPIATQTGVQPGLVQVAPGGRVVTGTAPNEAVIITLADTAVSGGLHCGGARCPELTNTGVPFAYTDTTVRNGFRYFYSVTAFDVNSVASVGVGNTSLESPLVTRTATPRAGSGQEVAGTATFNFLGADGNPIPVNPMPALDPVTGNFAGLMPVTDGLSLSFAAQFLPQVVSAGAVTVTIDSIIPGSSLVDVRPTVYWFSRQAGTSPPVQFSLSITPYGFDGDHIDQVQTTFPAQPLDATQAARFGGDASYSLYAGMTLTVGGVYGNTQKGRAWANAHPDGAQNGPRWWEGTGPNPVADPNGINCNQQIGSFSCALADLSRNSGQITGVDVFTPMSYTTIQGTTPARNWEAITSTIHRAATFRVYWGANGAIDSVWDATHRVRVPFMTTAGPSWGILNDSSFTNTPQASTRDANNALLTWSDLSCVAPIHTYLLGGNAVCGGPATTSAFLMNHARLAPVAFTSSSFANTATLTTNGNGFIFYLNGWFTLFRMAALPAAGTVWTMESYAGNIEGDAGSYSYFYGPRQATVPGLRLAIQFTGSTLDPSVTTAAALERVHTVPDPYYVTNALEFSSTNKILRFVNLPAQAIVRIYSTSGILVSILTHNDPQGGGDAVWNLRNRNNQIVASGVYFYHVETPDGREKVGRFTVVNYAQ
jgi:hypothetical protein